LALVPISPEKHAKTKVRPLSSFSFAAETTAIPVFGGEIVVMGRELPVAFARDAAGIFPTALLGLQAGQNLMIDPQGRWLGAHVPAIWRRGPFRLAQIEGGSEGEPRMALCLDDSSELLNESEGMPLFDDSGAPTALIDSAKTLLSQIERDARTTRTVCALLSRLDLFTPWNLEIALPDGSKQRVADLFQIDESRIATLSAEALVEIRDAGALPLIYAHLLSLSRTSLLGRLATMAHERAQQQAAMQKGNLNLDRAFGIVEDDPFLF